jgi:hypothetical protein
MEDTQTASETAQKTEQEKQITKVTVYTSKKFRTSDMQGMGSDKFNPEPTGETFQKDGKTWGIFRVRRGKRIFYYLGDVHEAPEKAPRKNQQAFSANSRVGIPVDVNSIIR